MILSRLLSSLIFALLLVPLLAQAEVRLETTNLWRHAQVLPSGQQVWSFESSYQDVQNRFSADGRVESLGSPFSRKITWNQLASSATVNANDVRNFMAQNNLNGNSIAATSSFEVDRREVGVGVNWAYGLTRHWMIGVRIPLTLTTTHVNQTYDLSPDLSQGIQASNTPRIMSLKPQDVKATIRDLAATQLRTSGYDGIPENKSSWNFSDISLLSQFILAQNYNWTWSLQQVVRFPTAQNPSVSDYLQTSQDQGPIDVGVSALVDFRYRKWIFGTRGGYTAQLPDNARMRVPNGGGDTGVDPKVHRDLGDWVWGAVDAEYRVNRRLGLLAEYSFLTKNRDVYDGDIFTDTQYAELADNTDQRLSEARLGVTYRFGSETSRGGVTNKWVAALDYNYPMIGSNAAEAARTSLELMNYF